MIQATLLASMGSDLTVVNAARVSFAKHTASFREDKDAKLIRYLAKHGHWSPFAHVTLQFHIAAPVFVARQLAKHQVGGVWNEVSRRYVDSEPEFYWPKAWRSRPVDKKQGSGPGEVELNSHIIARLLNDLRAAYNLLIGRGVAPEQARMILPQSLMTEWYWTGSLFFFARVCRQRLSPHAQEETRQVAEQIAAQASAVAPVSWNALMVSETSVPES